MQGKILNISGACALIRAENQDKLEVPLSEIKSELSPRVGDDVDFDLVEGKVVSVYILRQSTSIDQHLSAAKDTANHIYQQVKSNINEESLERAKALAAKATGKAKEKLQAIDLSKTKETLTSVEMPTLSSVSGLSLHNKFALFTLTCLFVSMLLPAVNLGFDTTVSYWKFVDNVTLQVIFMLVSAVSLAIGAPRFVSKTLCVICLVTVVAPLYDVYNSISEVVDAGREFGIKEKNITSQLMKAIEIGLPILLISILLFFITTLLPRYKTSSMFSASSDN
ncbi:hypothetical protein [Shewanella chilikensis]|uniref:hypothetical protein n=1 Tax=Shewanella chilikensis TaxID=558541 RepID=UPI00399AC0F3